MQITDKNYTWTMTLGELLDKLYAASEDKPVYVGVEGDYPTIPESYRGYYNSLAVGTQELPKDVADFIVELEAADGASYTGYKGGSYHMTLDTDIWAAEYGSTGYGIVDVVEEADYVLLVTADVG